MKKNLILALSILSIGSVFAVSAVDQAAAKAAMTECLKTKTQQECSVAQSVAQKAAAAKSGTSATAQ